MILVSRLVRFVFAPTVGVASAYGISIFICSGDMPRATIMFFVEF